MNYTQYISSQVHIYYFMGALTVSMQNVPYIGAHVLMYIRIAQFTTVIWLK